MCTLEPSPQALRQRVLDKLGKQKHAKVKKTVSATHTSDKECHKILRGEDSCYTKVKALKYLDHIEDSVGHQKVMEKLSAPMVRYQTTGMLQAAQDVHDAGCQDVLKARHYDVMWYRRVGKWLQYILRYKAYQT